MIVPRFWAEGRVQQRFPDRQVTVRRYGWSDESERAAQAHADARAREAFARIVAGEALPRRDPKVPYNGAEGVPIREEIVERHGDAVITRNAYGARCLNTPDVLFADVDFADALRERWPLGLVVSALVLGVAFGLVRRSFPVGLCTALAAMAAVLPVAGLLRRLVVRVRGGVERVARARVAAFVKRHPGWHLRVYRTPAELRVLAMHRTFDPREAAVAAFFRALRTDPRYAQMCQRQRCFRARVSPKPWRIGIAGHLRPRPGVWPVKPERLPERRRWIDAYEAAARDHAACRFVEALGSAEVHPAALAVQTVHDALSRAQEPLPIA